VTLSPAVVIHIDGAGKDEDVTLRAHEARRVATLLLQAAADLDAEAAR
jgi:hypothetical protein